jgi:FkbM family methyltransferase
MAETRWFTTPNGHEACFALREGTNDYNVVYSINGADEYLLAGRSFEGWALDLGSHIGAVAIALALDNADLRVVAVEPVPDNIALIEQNAQRNDLSRVEVLPAAIGAPGTRTIVRFGFRTDDGLFDHHAWIGNAAMVYADPPPEPHDELEVGCVDLLELRDKVFAGEPPSFVKIDVEGGEWDALEQLVALGAPRVIGEWHPVLGHTRADTLREAFEAAGYRVELDGPESGPGLFVATR